MTNSRPKTANNVAKAAGIIMFAMIVSRILGFFKEMIIGSQFGASHLTDAYIAAFTVPDLLYYLLVGGALSAAFIPVFSEFITKEQEEEGWKVASTVINLIVIMLIIGVALGELFAPYLVPLVAHNFRGEQLALTVKLTRIMFPAVLFTGLSGLAMGILNSYHHFTSPMLGGIIYNIMIILAGLFLGPRIGIIGLTIGVLCGAFGNFAIQIPSLIKRKIHYYPIIDLQHPGVRQIGKLMVPAILGLSITQINLIINQNVASGLAEGSIAALRFANRLMQLPIGIFAVAISMAIFPTLTKLVARGEIAEYKRTFATGFRSIVFIMMPAAVGLIVLRVPIVRLLFQQGEFNAAATAATAYALLFYALGIVFQGVLLIITRAFYALQDTATPVKVGLFTVFLNLGLNLALVNYLGHGGVALAFSIVSVVNVIMLMLILRKRLGGIEGKNIIKSFLKSLLAAVAMGIAAAWSASLLQNWVDISSKMGQAIQVGVAILVGAAVYGAIVMALKMEEVKVVFDIMQRRRKRRQSPEKAME